MAVFYGLYTLVRDINGDKPVSVERALTNAHRIISLERHLNVFHEASVQQLFLHDRDLMRFWDGFYGTVHFLAAIGVLVYLFLRRPEIYRLWRNTLAATTGLALVGFYFFPLLPPRLLPASYHFDDTLRTIGGLWDFSSGAVDQVSNQFAAMPSLHTGWSLWCALALGACVRPRWARIALLAYPAATVFCIIITANHYFADAAGGVLTLALGFALAWMFTRWTDHRRQLRALRGTRLEDRLAGPPLGGS
ncbi:phosphatase PAP2 family protein [Acidiferrimicrobium sp. IK]|uniref:phosphatase PAP2 family protein n=1 Tax=Acidiferrimicrobium sp. IK TaxID=2871700 RepID=UPI0021CB1286|nr:phosphatase PAP2 family protein [Acidiferrimicrobium sp. IK]MCU4185350.1 phosphatase PAP2 family protein [Acidiferrimicrobium sp. IK]